MSARQQLEEGLSSLGLTASNEQINQLLAYGDLILKWNKVYNLTALRDESLVLSHHLLDSLAVLPGLDRFAKQPAGVLDVGSGAGLPGVVIAIMRPDRRVTCLDAVAKKMAFVQQVAAQLQVPNLRAVHQRIEQHQEQYALVVSRAFASLKDFVEISSHVLDSGGAWMAMKSKSAADEIAALDQHFDVFHVEHLQVPFLEAERCVVWIKKRH